MGKSVLRLAYKKSVCVWCVSVCVCVVCIYVCVCKCEVSWSLGEEKSGWGRCPGSWGVWVGGGAGSLPRGDPSHSQLVPLLPRSVRDERGVHLHGPAPGMAFQLGRLLWLRLHPGLGGLPPGTSQRCHLCDLAEA